MQLIDSADIHETGSNRMLTEGNEEKLIFGASIKQPVINFAAM